MQNRIHLVAGLGNPGEEYAGTRHNAGFMALDALISKMTGTFEEKKWHNAITFHGRCRGAEIIFVKPQTFMNLSGDAVKLIAGKHNIYPEEILLIFDDIDLPLGKIRLRAGGGGSGGHNGVESVISRLGSADFSRLRIGIGRGEGSDQAGHVLAEFADNEKELFSQALDKAVDAAKFILYRGIEEAMNRFNTRR